MPESGERALAGDPRPRGRAAAKVGAKYMHAVLNAPTFSPHATEEGHEALEAARRLKPPSRSQDDTGRRPPRVDRPERAGAAVAIASADMPSRPLVEKWRLARDPS